MFEQSFLLIKDMSKQFSQIGVDIHADIDGSYFEELKHIEFGYVEHYILEGLCCSVSVHVQFL